VLDINALMVMFNVHAGWSDEGEGPRPAALGTQAGLEAGDHRGVAQAGFRRGRQIPA
jgi:hypothetical protein